MTKEQLELKVEELNQKFIKANDKLFDFKYKVNNRIQQEHRRSESFDTEIYIDESYFLFKVNEYNLNEEYIELISNIEKIEIESKNFANEYYDNYVMSYEL